ncbi:TetR/AcrR family transcriptional regulator [Plantactinospora endophytica]|uniref:TetR family transcriptional regulator n=1 Tax=Plantactinospora endophytica TaxID=673535 RepID=A0ABQ4DZ55_9ACTN|nr:TetR/AcrR family transcriptional regulator [Plantactinospora endophytica]GIG87717.1 TetR family transcriptional regulator [Plantactinospora endophytica]
MTRSPALRDHIAAGILSSAAAVLGERGEAASMADIAEAAGVSRATLYRYFPNRDALLDALTDAAFTDLSEKIADAKLDTVPVEEAIARLTRAMIAATSKYRALGLLEKSPEQHAQAKSRLVDPFYALFQRGINDGTLRTDLPAHTLIAAYQGLFQGAASQVNQGRLGVEEASAAITTIFLDGALGRQKHR